jgi:hypothetical protein
MKTCKPLFFTTLMLFAALAITVRTSAQSQTSPSDAAAKGNFTKFDVKGAGSGANQGTFPLMNNTGGAITGYYIDANNTSHGFLRAPDNGEITRINVKGAGKGNFLGTQALTINSRGDIAGFYQNEHYVFHGFLLADDKITTFNVKGAGTGKYQGTVGRSINRGGTIAGIYADASDNLHGYVRAPDGKITPFDVPGAGKGFGQGTQVAAECGINPEGEIVGSYIDSNNRWHGYVRSANGKKFTTIDGPGAVFTFIECVATNGTVVGVFQDTNNVYHGLLSTPPYTNITEFDDPKAGTGGNQGTTGYAINPAGTIVGIYTDASNVTHGFRGSGGKFHTLDVPGASGTYPATINNKGEIPGFYFDFDKNNAAHGFLWTP